eukprot:779384_1
MTTLGVVVVVFAVFVMLLNGWIVGLIGYNRRKQTHLFTGSFYDVIFLLAMSDFISGFNNFWTLLATGGDLRNSSTICSIHAYTFAFYGFVSVALVVLLAAVRYRLIVSNKETSRTAILRTIFVIFAIAIIHSASYSFGDIQTDDQGILCATDFSQNRVAPRVNAVLVLLL